MLILEQPNGCFVERGTAHFHMGRRPEPIEQAWPILVAAAARGLQQIGVFVPAPIP
jgi:hypothetical protein